MSHPVLKWASDGIKSQKFKRYFWLGLGLLMLVLLWSYWPVESRPGTVKRKKTVEPPPPMGTHNAFVVRRANETYDQEVQNKILLEQEIKHRKALEARLKQLSEQRTSELRNGTKAKSLSPEQVAQIVQQQLAMYEQSKAAEAYTAPAEQKHPPVQQTIRPDIDPMPHKGPDTESALLEVNIPAGTVFPVDSYSGVAALADSSREVHSVVRISKITHPNGPNGSLIPLEGCRITIVADIETADEVLARIPFRGERLSCVLSDGTTINEEIDGQIVDTTDTPGFQAAVYSQHFEHFKEIAKAVGPSVISDLIRAGKDTTTQTSVFGTVTETGTSATADIARDVGQLYLRSAEAYIRPIMLAKSNDKGYFWTRKPLVLKGVTPQMLAANRGAGRVSYR